MWRFPGKNREWKWAHIPIFGCCPPPNFLLVCSALFLLTSPCAHHPMATPSLGWSSEDLCPSMCPVWGWGLLGITWRTLPAPFPTSSLTLSSSRSVPRKLPCEEWLTESSKLAPRLTEILRSLKTSCVRNISGERKLALFSFPPQCMLCME